MNARRTMKEVCSVWISVVAAMLLCLAATLSNSSMVRAQSFYGSVVGTVTDDSGAVVPDATVTITNIGTNDVRTTKADATGAYRFINLVPAAYKVDINAENYKRFVRQSVQVTVDTTVRVDAALQVGATTETVEVTTQTPLLQTESGTLGDTVEGKQVQQIPLNGRNTFNLMALVPGVVPQGNTGGSAAMNNNGSTSSAAWGNYQIGGGLPLQGSIYIDGSPTSIMNKSFAVVVPTPDIIQEFKIETAGVAAEFGRLGGGVVNMLTKSGTNEFHGGVYEYIRNSAVNANYFFTKRNGAARPQWTQNQYGGFIGGPIWKNKAFGFFAWEEIHIRTGNPTLTNVPTSALQSGVFSTLTKAPTDPLGNCTFAPYTGQSVTDLQGKSHTFTAGGYYISNLWQGACGDATAKILGTFYPTDANNPGNAASNWYKTVSQGNDGHQVTGRVDWNISGNDRFFARFTLWPLVDAIPNVMGNPNGWNNAGSQTHNHTNNIVAGNTYTFNPTTVLDVRVDYLRQYGDAIPPAFGKVDVTQFGPAYKALAPYMTYQYYPAWSFSGNHNIFNFTYNNLTRTYYNNYHLSAAVTKILGKHSLKAGIESRLIQREDVGSTQNPSGNYTIKNDIGTNDEWANFLLGYFDSGAIQTVKAVTSFSRYYGFYAQDVWQPLPKLTLNLGLRYELPGAIAENRDNMAVLLPDVTDQYTGIKGTEGLVASSLYGPRTTLVPVHNAIGPRFGFAYRLTNDTVIRGGYGLTYLPNDQQTGAYANAATINSQTTTNTDSASNLKPGCLTAASPCYTLANPFPATAALPNGIGPAQGRSYTNFMVANIAGNVTGPYPWQPYPMSQGMNLTIARQFRGDLLVEVGAAHTIGTHLNSLGNVGFDQLPDQYDSLGTALGATTPVLLNGVAPKGLPQTYGQSLRPFPYYKNYSNTTDFHSTSTYNAMEMKVQKRFKSSGQIGAAYTWSKMLTDTDSILTTQEAKSGGSAGEGVYQDYTNRKADRSIYSFNVPNRLVFNYVVNLPFGHGQKFGADAHGAVDKVISGWSLSGITTYQTGYPLYFYLNGSTNGVSNITLSQTYGAGTMRPNVTAGCTKTVSGSRYARTLPGATWFNNSISGSNACFTVPAVGTAQQGYTFGNEPRTDGNLKMDGIKNWDFSVVKNTSIHEKIGSEFRLEFFNIFNRTQFGPPVTGVDNALFGRTTSQVNKPRLIQGALRLTF
jgi:hypothetical protein